MKLYDPVVSGSLQIDSASLETYTETTESTQFLVIDKDNVVKRFITSMGALAIFIVLAGDVQSATATVVWATNKDATGEVMYGLSRNALDQTTGPQDPAVDTKTKYHKFLLENLGLETTYYFKVKSRTLTETVESDVYFFETSNIFNPVYTMRIFTNFSVDQKSLTYINNSDNINALTSISMDFAADVDNLNDPYTEILGSLDVSQLSPNVVTYLENIIIYSSITSSTN